MTKYQKISKGAPSGFVISIMVHAAAFLIAGMLVVFTVSQKEEKKFVPPKTVDRPKMKLKKPKVKIKKSAKPKPTTRIVTKVQKATMPDIQLPEMSGMGEGMVGGIGEFDLMPELGQVTVFGGGQTIGSDFVGTFYDFKRDRVGNQRPMDETAMQALLSKFCSSGWKTSRLSQYYQSPKKLYATSIFLPLMPSTLAPFAFDEPDTIACQWAVHYKGKLVHPEDIKFRFWGHGDDIMIVRVDGEIVLDASWDSEGYGARYIANGGKWVSKAPGNRTWHLGNNLAWGGDWIELKAGEPLDMEVLVGEQPGGNFCAMLLVEVDGVEYEMNNEGRGIFPIFRTAPTSHDVADAIYQHMFEDEADVLGGPVFCDIGFQGKDAGEDKDATEGATEDKTEDKVAVAVEEAPEPQAPAPEESPLHLWTFANGQSLEAEFISKMGDKYIFRTAKNKNIKIPATQMSREDLGYIQLANPPKFDVGIIRSSSPHHIVLSTQEIAWNNVPPRVIDWTFGAKVRQKGSGEYNHELTLEYYALAQQQVDADKYRILDHQSAVFTPTVENKGSFDFRGERISRVFDFVWGGNGVEQRRGHKLAETMVLLTDSRGEIVAYSSTANWLYKNLEELRKREVGNYIDKSCKQVYASGPNPVYW